MPTEGGQFVLASIIDITERLSAEKLARAAQTDTAMCQAKGPQQRSMVH